MSLTKFPNGLSSYLVDSNATNVTANTTVVIGTDSGKTFASTTDAITYTLPSIAIGNTFTFVNDAPDGTAAVTIQPAAIDAITHKGAAVDNTPIANTKATAKRGDFVTLASLDGVIAWQVVASRGIWA